MSFAPLKPLQRLAEIAVDRGARGAWLHALAEIAKPNLEGMPKGERDAVLDALRELHSRIHALDAEERALRKRVNIDEKLAQRLAGHERQTYDEELQRLRGDRVDALVQTLKPMPLPKRPNLLRAARPARRGYRARRSRSTSRRGPPARTGSRSGDDDPPPLGAAAALAGALLALAARARRWS
jgi:hypothetical protein